MSNKKKISAAKRRENMIYRETIQAAVKSGWNWTELSEKERRNLFKLARKGVSE